MRGVNSWGSIPTSTLLFFDFFAKGRIGCRRVDMLGKWYSYRSERWWRAVTTGIDPIGLTIGIEVRGFRHQPKNEKASRITQWHQWHE